MNYQYDMILEKEAGYGYTLKSVQGTKVYEFTASSNTEAMMIANAWMSSWFSVRITLKGEDEQLKKRD